MAGKRIGKTYTTKVDDKKIVDIENEVIGTKITETEEIPLITKQSTDSKIKIDFLDDDTTASFISEPTKTATEDTDNKDNSFSFSNKTPNEIKEQVKQEENEYSKELTVEDFQEVAEFLIDLVDFGVISLARFISKENTDQPFEVSEKKKRKLIKQLTLIAIKHKLNIGIELLFVATLLMVYVGPIKKAIKIKNEKYALNKAKKNNGIKEPLT